MTEQKKEKEEETNKKKAAMKKRLKSLDTFRGYIEPILVGPYISFVTLSLNVLTVITKKCKLLFKQYTIF